MRLKRHIARVMALFILLVFTQKIGLGLFFHNAFHPTTIHAVKLDGPISEKASNTNCSCIDDFLLPFTAATAEELVAPKSFNGELISFYQSQTPQSAPHFNSLRGPPAAQS